MIELEELFINQKDITNLGTEKEEKVMLIAKKEFISTDLNLS